MGRAERQLRRSKLSNRQDVVFKELQAVKAALREVQAEQINQTAFLRRKFPQEFVEMTKSGLLVVK